MIAAPSIQNKSTESCSCFPNKAPSLDNTGSFVASTDYQVVMRGMRRIAGELGGGSIASCGNWNPAAGQMQILKGENERFFYSGAEKCGSVWGCPVCAYKIIQERAEEVARTVTGALEKEYRVGMITLTIPHHRFQGCKELQKAVSESYRNLLNRRKWRELKKKYGFIGNIRALETTYGGNGWHPHLHVLVIAECEERDLEMFAWEIFEMWADIVEKSGFGVCNSQAFDFQPVIDAEGVSEYVQKWNIAKEITAGGLMKKANGKNRNPFEILFCIYNELGDVKNDKKLFGEYLRAFKGAKQLTFTKGLTGLCPETEKTDEEIVKERKEGEKICGISGKIWNPIWNRKLEGKVLVITGKNGPEKAAEWLRTKKIDCAFDGVDLIPVMRGSSFLWLSKTPPRPDKSKAYFDDRGGDYFGLADEDREITVRNFIAGNAVPYDRLKRIGILRKELKALRKYVVDTDTGEILGTVGTKNEINRYHENIKLEIAEFRAYGGD